MIVEDNASVAAGIADLLLNGGFAVRIAFSGWEALRIVEDEVPDVVILDVHLPDLTGDELFRNLRSRWPTLPVVFSSGHVRDISEIVEGEPRRVELLRKPYGGEQLTEAIGRVMSSKSS